MKDHVIKSSLSRIYVTFFGHIGLFKIKMQCAFFNHFIFGREMTFNDSRFVDSAYSHYLKYWKNNGCLIHNGNRKLKTQHVFSYYRVKLDELLE